jgi:integrase
MDGMRKPGEAKARERVLSDDEIRALWNALPETLPRSKAVQKIIKLCLVTGQRVGEVIGIHSNELDLKQKIWSIPGARTKHKHKHLVPLSDLAANLIGVPQGFLFPNEDSDGSLPAHAVAKTITKAQERFGLLHWTAHDLRRTVVTRMAELGIAPIVLWHVINHRSVTKAGVTLSVYSQHSYEREKREALELWADRLEAIVSSPNSASILPLRGTV